MDNTQFKQLKDLHSAFLNLCAQYRRANQKEKKKLQSDIETLQNRMVRDHELNKIDPYIYNSIRNGDYDWFKTDMEKILEELSGDLTEEKD